MVAETRLEQLLFKSRVSSLCIHGSWAFSRLQQSRFVSQMVNGPYDRSGLYDWSGLYDRSV